MELLKLLSTDKFVKDNIKWICKSLKLSFPHLLTFPPFGGGSMMRRHMNRWSEVWASKLGLGFASELRHLKQHDFGRLPSVPEPLVSTPGTVLPALTFLG